MIKLTPTQITVDAAAAEGLPSRSISGVAVTYDETATVSDGTQVRFLQGSLPVTGRDPKLYMQHDSNQIVGKVVERVDTAQGMMFTAKISATRLGDEALTLANDGVIDAVSVGVTPTKFRYDEDGVMIVEAANWSELSLVSEGAFAGAIITDVAASAPDEPAVEGIHETEPQVELISDQETTQETDMTDKNEQPVVEAAQATVDKLWAQPKREFRMPSVGEYLAAYHIGGDTFRKVNEEFVGAQKAKQSVLEAAAGDIATTDTPGLLPVPVLGPVFQDINFIRPFVTAIGARAYPDGGTQKTFIRPTITTHTSVAEQTGAVEFGAASATTMVIAANSVTKKTFAGQVTLSVQDIDFTSPAAMTQIMNDLMGQYMIATDNFAVDTFVTGASTQTNWDGTPEDLIATLYVMAQKISSGTNLFPTHMLVGPDAWAKLGSAVDADKRPLFPAIGQPGLGGYNTLGAGSLANWATINPLGLQMIVDSNVAAKTIAVFHAPASEYYEAIRGLLSVENPGTLSRTFSYYGYASFFQAKATLAYKTSYA
jgi:HK97 family phage prohead protease